MKRRREKSYKWVIQTWRVVSNVQNVWKALWWTKFWWRNECPSSRMCTDFQNTQTREKWGKSFQEMREEHTESQLSWDKFQEELVAAEEEEVSKIGVEEEKSGRTWCWASDKTEREWWGREWDSKERERKKTTTISVKLVSLDFWRTLSHVICAWQVYRVSTNWEREREQLLFVCCVLNVGAIVVEENWWWWCRREKVEHTNRDYCIPKRERGERERESLSRE